MLDIAQKGPPRMRGPLCLRYRPVEAMPAERRSGKLDDRGHPLASGCIGSASERIADASHRSWRSPAAALGSASARGGDQLCRSARRDWRPRSPGPSPMFHRCSTARASASPLPAPSARRPPPTQTRRGRPPTPRHHRTPAAAASASLLSTRPTSLTSTTRQRRTCCRSRRGTSGARSCQWTGGSSSAGAATTGPPKY